MTALAQDNVGEAVPIKVANIYASRRFSLFLQKQHTVKRGKNLTRWGWCLTTAARR